MTTIDKIGQPKIAILVVAYNAESTLVATLNRIPAHVRSMISELFILDDASQDGTYELARAWAAANTSFVTVVVRHPKNLGYGGNQKEAYRLASERGIDVVVLLHADGQYAPELLGDVIAPIIEGRADAVFGSRMMVKGAAKAGRMPMYKRLGNRVLTAFENKALGADLTEYHSGYRAYRVATLDALPVQENSDDFHFDTQIIVQLMDAGKDIVEVPIPTYYGDEICYVNGMRYARDVVMSVIRYRLAKAGFGSPAWVPTQNEYLLKDAPESSHQVIEEMLGELPLGRVLDVGCSGGLLSHMLQNQGHEVTGVDTVRVGDIEDRVTRFVLGDAQELAPALVGDRFDYIVAGDVIEHLAKPKEALRGFSDLLDSGGELVISVPNFGHLYPRVRVLLGVFGYDRRGILDQTHLKFFTRSGIKELVKSAGFDILEERHTATPGAPGGLIGRLEAFLRRLRPEIFAYQTVLRCTPHAGHAAVTVFEPVSSSRPVHSVQQPSELRSA